MAPWKPVHNQTLDQVKTKLREYDSVVAKMILDTLDTGSVQAIDIKNLREVKPKFGPTMWDAPLLAGPEVSPWQVPPSLDSLRCIVKEEMRNKRVNIIPSSPTKNEDEKVALQLLDHLEDPNYSISGSIHNLTSPLLTQSLTGGSQSLKGWEHTGILEVTLLIVNVMPARGGYDLDHCEGYMLNTLLSGTRVWIVYPPTESNLHSLCEKWEALAKSDEYWSIPYWKQMDSGIAIIQHPGQTLHIPPFCPYLVCSLETSISAEYWIITAKKLPLRLQNTRLVVAQNSCEPSTVRQSKLIQSADSVYSALHMILSEAVDKFDHVQTIIKICRVWAEAKDDVLAMCEAIEDPAISVAMGNKFKGTWIQFLEQKMKKSGSCRLCQLQIKGTGLSLAEHFHQAHWSPVGVMENSMTLGEAQTYITE
jgi:hypothetical protein